MFLTKDVTERLYNQYIDRTNMGLIQDIIDELRSDQGDQ